MRLQQVNLHFSKGGEKLVEKNKKLFLVLSIISVLIIGGFITKSLADEKPKVVVVLKQEKAEYWKIIKAGAEKGFQDFGIEGEVIASHDGSIEDLKNILENVYKEKPDAIIFSPDHSLNLITDLEKFSKEGIPVLLISTNLDWEKKTSYIGTNNLDLGERAGAFLASELQPEDKVAIISGDKTHPVFVERIRGYKKTLTDAGIDVAVEELSVPDDAKVVKKVMTKVLQDYPDLKGIIATHDVLALQVLKEIQEQGLNIPVIGSDGTTEMLGLIEEGTIPGTVAQNPYDMGYLSVDTAQKVLNGDKVEKFVDGGVDIMVKGNAQARYDFLSKLVNHFGVWSF